MTPSFFEKTPYLDWRIDIWKLLFLLFLFCLLLIGALLLPNGTSELQTGIQQVALDATEPLNTGETIEGTNTLSDRESSNPGLSNSGSSYPVPSSPAPSNATQISNDALSELSGPRAQIDANFLVEDRNRTDLPMQEQPRAIPLTLSNIAPNALLSEDQVSLLQGTAAPNSALEVRIDSLPLDSVPSAREVVINEAQLLGVTQADTNGFWSFPLAQPLPPGRHTLVVRQLPPEGGVGIRSTERPVVITIMMTIGITVDGILQPVLPATVTEPQITSPADGVTLLNIPLTFGGNAPAGLTVALFLNEQLMGATQADVQQAWALPLSTLPIGDYTAHVEVMGLDGKPLSKSPAIQFVIQEDYPRGG